MVATGEETVDVDAETSMEVRETKVGEAVMPVFHVARNDRHRAHPAIRISCKAVPAADWISPLDGATMPAAVEAGGANGGGTATCDQGSNLHRHLEILHSFLQQNGAKSLETLKTVATVIYPHQQEILNWIGRLLQMQTSCQRTMRRSTNHLKHGR